MTQSLWRDGDSWCHLTELVELAQTATVVSESGTAVLLDLDRGRYRRVPLEGGHLLPGDSLWLPLGTFALTPCGLVIDGAYPYWGTRVRLVCTGLHELWVHS